MIGWSSRVRLRNSGLICLLAAAASALTVTAVFAAPTCKVTFTVLVSSNSSRMPVTSEALKPEAVMETLDGRG